MSKCWSRILVSKRFGPYNYTRLLALSRKGQSLSTTASQDSEFNLGHDIYVSASSDPYFNLSLEDLLFRNSEPASPLLLIYRDSPCVVIGRHQNPWTELNFNALRLAGFPFLRRRSGGGTVYHDLGNTNFSIHVPRSAFDRHITGNIVLRAVRSLGIDATLNDRNDIVVGRFKMRSAYKIVRQRGYHHGTMLISTKLDTLADVLHPPQQHIITKGVASVRSEVRNLTAFNGAVTHEAFASAVVAEFRKEFGITTDIVTVHDTKQLKSLEDIRRGMEELSSWEWKFGQTPEFTRSLVNTFPWGEARADIRSKQGVIHNLTLQVHTPHLSPANVDMIHHICRKFYDNKRYGFLPTIDPERLNLDELGTETPRIETDDWDAIRRYLREISMWIDKELRY